MLILLLYNTLEHHFLVLSDQDKMVLEGNNSKWTNVFCKTKKLIQYYRQNLRSSMRCKLFIGCICNGNCTESSRILLEIKLLITFWFSDLSSFRLSTRIRFDSNSILNPVSHFNRIVAKRSVFYCFVNVTIRFATIRLKGKTGLGRLTSMGWL